MNFSYWWRESGTAFALRFIFLVGVMIASFASVIWAVVVQDCKAYGQTTSRPTKVVFGSCYIQDKTGQWWDSDEFKLLNATRAKS